MATIARDHEPQADDSIEDTAREAPTLIRYLAPGDFVTRRYVKQGAEMNTGDYADYECVVRDGMPMRNHFTLDRHGFMIATAPTGIADFHDKASVDADYLAEVERHVKALTGADRVAAQGWMIRTSGDLSQHAQEKTEGYQHAGGIQPPAGEAHVDYNEATGQRAAARVHGQRFADAPPYKRYLCFSFWRTFSPGPQDWPLALCDGRSVEGADTASNTLFVVDEFPNAEDAVKPVEGEDQMIAASIFRYSPNHRWWYFSDMAKDDALLFKFQDSDHSVTWRCPHTAFHDGTMPDAKIRSSIEVRGVAFWE